MSLFWVIGIILNVVLTGAAVYWVFRQMKPKEKQAGIARPEGSETPLAQPAPEDPEPGATRR